MSDYQSRRLVEPFTLLGIEDHLAVELISEKHRNQLWKIFIENLMGRLTRARVYQINKNLDDITLPEDLMKYYFACVASQLQEMVPTVTIARPFSHPVTHDEFITNMILSMETDDEEIKRLKSLKNYVGVTQDLHEGKDIPIQIRRRIEAKKLTDSYILQLEDQLPENHEERIIYVDANGTSIKKSNAALLMVEHGFTKSTVTLVKIPVAV